MYLAYKKLDYPYNLIHDVFDNGRGSGDKILEEIKTNVSNVPDAVNYALNGLPTKGDLKQILEYRYKDKMTYGEIAAIFGVSGERIRQKILKALIKLRHPKLNRALRYGLEVRPPLTTQDITEFLTFSVRTSGCLMRHNITNMRELSKTPYNKLARTQNLGIKSMNEIISKLEKCGYDTTHLKVGMKNIKIKDVEFSTRTRNCLKHARIYSMNDLYDLAYNHHLMEVPRVGIATEYPTLNLDASLLIV